MTSDYSALYQTTFRVVLDGLLQHRYLARAVRAGPPRNHHDTGVQRTYDRLSEVSWSRSVKAGKAQFVKPSEGMDCPTWFVEVFLPAARKTVREALEAKGQSSSHGRSIARV